MSGIFRDVYLYAVSEVHIRDYYVYSEFDDSYQDAVLHLWAKIQNYGHEAVESHKISGYLMEIDGTVIAKLDASIPKIVTLGEATIKVATVVKAPRKW